MADLPQTIRRKQKSSTAKYKHKAGDGRCCAQAKSTGKRCKNSAVPGGIVCNMHGGNVPAGKESPQWKHGRYSQHLPDNLAQRFEQAMNDPALLELRSEIALVEARLADVLERAREHENREAWDQLQSLASELKRTSNPDAARQIVRRIVALIEGGGQEHRAWGEVYDLIDQRRRLVNSENRHIAEQERYITTDRLATIMGAFIAIVKEEVHDKDVRRRIGRRLRSLFH